MKRKPKYESLVREYAEAKNEQRNEMKKRIGTLPRWAIVALAARCARRVVPFYDQWEGATEESKTAVKRAIEFAETSASQASSGNGRNARRLLSEIQEVERATKQCYLENLSLDVTGAFGAAQTARYALAAAEAAEAGDAKLATQLALRSAEVSATVCGGLPFTPVDAGTHDLEFLEVAAKRGGWDDNTPVKKEFFENN